MAYILYKDRTATEIEVAIAGLSASYAYEGRYFQFFIQQPDVYGTEDWVATDVVDWIPGGKEETESYWITGLHPETNYKVKVTISNIVTADGYTSLDVLEIKNTYGYAMEEIYTGYAMPKIKKFEVTPIKHTSNSRLRAICSFTLTNVTNVNNIKNGDIYVRPSNTNQAFRTATILNQSLSPTDSTITIEFAKINNATTYDFKIEIEANDYVVNSLTYSVMFAPSYISQFYVDVQRPYKGYEFGVYFKLRNIYDDDGDVLNGDVSFCLFDSAGHTLIEKIDGSYSKKIQELMDDEWRYNLNDDVFTIFYTVYDLSSYTQPFTAQLSVSILNNNGESMHDDVVTYSTYVDLSYDLTTKNLSVTRQSDSLNVTWTPARDAEYTNVYLKRLYTNNNSDVNMLQTNMSSCVFNRYYCSSGFYEYGVTYKLSAIAYKDNQYGDYAIIERITTHPAKPTISIESIGSDGTITINYGVQNLTNSTNIQIVLYEGSYYNGIIDNTTAKKEEHYISTNGNLNPSGKLTFTKKHTAGQYCVVALVNLSLSIDDSDGSSAVISSPTYCNFNVIGEDPNLKVTNQSISRTDESLTLTWANHVNATSVDIKFIRYGTEEYVVKNLRNTTKFVFNSANAGDFFQYGVTYQAQIQTHNGDAYGPWVPFGQITTHPAKPTISIESIGLDGTVTIKYGVKYNTNSTNIQILLYDGSYYDNITDNQSSLEEHYISTNGNLNPSGTLTFRNKYNAGKQYCVVALVNFTLATSDSDGSSSVTSPPTHCNFNIMTEDPNLKVINPAISRTVESLTLTWANPADITNVEIEFARQWDNARKRFTLDKVSTFVLSSTNAGDFFQYGVTYYVHIRAYNSNRYSPWTTLGPITTQPAKPTLTLDEISTDNKIMVFYGVSHGTNISRIQLELYEDDVCRYTAYYPGENAYVDNGYMTANPYGLSYQFDCTCTEGKTYRVKAWSYLELDSNNCDSDGDYQILSPPCELNITIPYKGLAVARLAATRRQDSWVVSWIKSDDATGVRIRLTDLEANSVYTVDAEAQKVLTMTPDNTNGVLKYGKKYTLAAQAYDSTSSSDWLSISPITSYPAKPKIIRSYSIPIDGTARLCVDWGVEHDTNLSSIFISLYKRNSSTGLYDQLESKSITTDNFMKAESAFTYQFSTAYDSNATYKITMQTILDLSYTDYGDVHTLRSDVASDQDSTTRPQNWTWTSAIKSGQTVNITNNTIYPVSASEWNAFTDRINEFRRYVNVSDSTFTTATSGGDFTRAIYNQAVSVINQLPVKTAVSTIRPGDELEPALFTALSDALNSIT